MAMTEEERVYRKPDGHAHGWRDPDCVPIGPTVCLTPVVHGGAPHITDGQTGETAGGPVEHLWGFTVAHDSEFDVRCEGMATVDPHHENKATWKMTGTLEGGDLTLTPSVVCTGVSVKGGTCGGVHGFVTDGKWVPA